MDTHLHTHKKLSASSAPRLHNGFESRPFATQTKAESDKQQPDLKTQLSKAERFGHNLSRVQVHATAPAATTVQTKSQVVVQREEQEGEEEEGAQMKAERVLHPLVQQKRGDGATGSNSPSIQRAEEGAEEEKEEAQMKADPGAKIQRKAGSTASLPPAVKTKMEGSFGTDFSDVSIQESPQAKAIGALAFTQGNQIHFAPGQYNPHSQSGQALLGHELTHVVQQRAGRVPVPTQSKGAPINADPALEREADDMGARAARGEQAMVPGSPFMARGMTQRKPTEPIQNSTQPVQFFLPMLLPMLMPMIQPMLQPILQQVIGGVFGGGGAGGAGGGAPR
ncbi:hypothetical protein BST81_19590 [Leptolyngbya sp. 'hensonii']|uniref:eCIS core domain-containing protein n=1 Tax=Leptolyngbya sp. 'hensonii' TaxID=1922337 RepID=UPI00094F7927|nr:DUF4157 domain-containing protein [Leptolyngbya sp. 'hensonii']OLP16643.1 hypothetical protein BST81_19590 [Leptolyngbya sp. 'hensonii']